MKTYNNIQQLTKALKLLSASLIMLMVALGSGCSLYTTNTDITFTSTSLLDQEPAIHVGDITETPDKLTFLGSIVATVKKPNPFDDNPTIAQANIVLAHQAVKMGADAVIHVKYKTGITEGRLDATGQAVKINTINSYNVKKDSIQKALEKFGLNLDESAQSAQPAQQTDTSTQQQFEQTTHNRQITNNDRTTNQKVIALAKALAKAEARAEAEAEEARSAEEFSQLDATADIDLIGHMISNIEYMMRIAKEHSDEDIYNMASILKRLLKQHLEKHQRQAAGYEY